MAQQLNPYFLPSYEGVDEPRGDLQQKALTDALAVQGMFAAQAATVPPVGPERRILWHTAAQVWLYCDGAAWKPMHGLKRRLVTGTRNFEIADTCAVLDVDSSNPVALTMVAETSVPWLEGTYIDIVRLGTGAVTIAAGAGVVIVQEDNKLALKKTGSPAQLQRTTVPNKWLLVGSLA